MGVQLAFDHAATGGGDGFEGGFVPLSEGVVGLGGGQFDGPVGMDEGGVDGAVAEREVVDRADGMDPIERIGGDGQAAQGILFGTRCGWRRLRGGDVAIGVHRGQSLLCPVRAKKWGESPHWLKPMVSPIEVTRRLRQPRHMVEFSSRQGLLS